MTSLSQYGSTALIETALYGYADCARLLLDAGADKNIVNNVRYYQIALTIVLFWVFHRLALRFSD